MAKMDQTHYQETSLAVLVDPPARSRRRCRQQEVKRHQSSNRGFFLRYCRLGTVAVLSGNHILVQGYAPLHPSKFDASQRSLFRSENKHTEANRDLQTLGHSSNCRSGRSAAVLRMVLTTPENIIEQASTQKLLDVLLDESVRTTARRPIMMQFDPSSGFVSIQTDPVHSSMNTEAILLFLII